MAGRLLFPIAWLIFLASSVNAQSGDSSNRDREPAIRSAVDRSLKLLAAEVPQWMDENHCASCHNQGDAAIALIEGLRLKLVDESPLRSTLDWLTQPNKWSTNRGLPAASDQQLANLQFAGALLSAYNLAHAKYQSAIDAAALILSADQAQDGSWKIVSGGSLASPITHGEILLTGTAIKVIEVSSVGDKDKQISCAKKWLSQQAPRNTLEAASLLIAMPSGLSNRETMISQCNNLILRSQDEQSGGWGPHGNAAPEVFDTALAVIALDSLAEKDVERSAAIERGIDYLIKEQFDDGSWPETTRPSNTVSYAHRISTTAWATRALMTIRKPSH